MTIQVKAPKQLVRLLSIEIDPSCFGFFFPSLYDCSKNLHHHLKLIRYKRKTNPILDTRIFPRFEQVTCFYFEFSLANDDVIFALIGD